MKPDEEAIAMNRYPEALRETNGLTDSRSSGTESTGTDSTGTDSTDTGTDETATGDDEGKREAPVPNKSTLRGAGLL
jgi:hypothetical protein